MQFKDGAAVLNANEEKLGSLNRVVIDPRTGEVTYVVVRVGTLISEDRVVPVDRIAWTREDEISLKQNVDDLQAFPLFEETHYVPVSEEEAARRSYPVTYPPPFFWYPAYGAPAMAYPGYPGEPVAVETERNIPQDTIALKENARVISEGGEHVGNIERVFADSDSGRVTHFLISRGLLLKERKLVPVAWIRDVSEDEVHLSVGSRQVDGLPDFEE